MNVNVKKKDETNRKSNPQNQKSDPGSASESVQKSREKSKYSKPGSLVWAMKKLWNTHKGILFFAFARGPLDVASSLVGAYFSKVLIDRIGEGRTFEELAVTTLSFVAALMVLQLLSRYVRGKLSGVNYYPTTVYQNEIGAFVGYETDYENTERQDFKKIEGYAWRDASEGRCSLEFIWENIYNFFKHALGIFTYASLMAALNPVIFAAVALVSALSYVTTRWQTRYREKNKHKWEKESRKKEYLERLSDNFPKAKDIKLYGLEEWLNKLMRDYQAYILMWDKRCSLRGVWAALLAGVMTLFQNGIAYIVLIESLAAGNITVGDFVFYFGLVGSIAGFLQGLIKDIAGLSARADKIAYYRELYDYPSRFNHGEGCALPAGPVRIELKDVWYRYDGAKEDTLKGINLCIEAGESLALVGVNGAGKTTLIKLICGMYMPSKGEILVGGKRIEEYNIEEYYSMISAVFQEIWPAAFTVFEFVASADLERPSAREGAAAAMKAAGIYEKIAGLQNGMDTHLMKGIYDDGVDLSGGEMQKLVLARAIYKDGPVLVLDEPTAALDPIAENNLYLQYRELTKGKTSIYISHRFASTRFCDRIVLLEDGRIKESGTHEELMKLNGRYAYMFDVQSKYYKDGPKDQTLQNIPEGA